MFKDFAKVFLVGKAAVDILKEKVESRICDLAVQVKNFKEGKNSKEDDSKDKETTQSKLKEKAKQELLQIISEITHRSQINELQLKGFIKDKLTELTNNALLDSIELNDIRAEIASLRAEIADLKSEMSSSRR